jgi:parvulin-like peptidyl-prolyl isomerase
MAFLLDTGAYLQEPAAGELEAYFAANEQTYRSGLRLALEQIYLGEDPMAEAISVSLGALRADPPADPATVGVRSLLPARLGLSPPTAVDGVFGKGFFDLAADLPPGEWAGPVMSAYGVHLVRILDTLPARTPPLEEIRDAVLRDWRAAKAREIREQDYAERRKRFVVEIRRRDEPVAEGQ